MEKIIVLESKYGNRYFKAFTDSQKQESLKEIFKYNKELGYYNDLQNPKEISLYNRIFREDDPTLVQQFLMHRSDRGYEYEVISFEDLE